MRRCLMTRQRRWATSMPKPHRGKQDCGSRDASRLGRSCAAMARWTVGDVAAWVADTPGLGPDVAHLLRVADIDGEALATLSENDMQDRAPRKTPPPHNEGERRSCRHVWRRRTSRGRGGPSHSREGGGATAASRYAAAVGPCRGGGLTATKDARGRARCQGQEEQAQA